ncbi:dermatan-sulfate epimerase-like protein [Ciona intestinalis]
MIVTSGIKHSQLVGFVILTVVLVSQNGGLAVRNVKRQKGNPSNGEKGKSTDDKHPMLYFNAIDIPRMRHKALNSHAKIAKIIQEAGRSLKEKPDYYLPPKSFESFGSRWNELYGNNLCAFAMYCVLHPDDTKALSLVKLYMDRMTSYPDWYVTASRNIDEVPIGHSLTGYVTAYDFLYPVLEPKRRSIYLERIGNETALMYRVVQKGRAGWTKQRIHNHAPTNVFALLIGAMVYEDFDPSSAKHWKGVAISMFEKALSILEVVVDGTSDEGVAYGSYTSRGLTQYIFMALRHFDTDHTQNSWLRQHFWFFFATTMPGFQRTVGIADSNHNWFYGPESQLVFLDAFVLRNGNGNWLADRIRSAKPKNPPLARSMSQKWSTVHTEFIFYDASLKSSRPVLPSNSSYHIFSDWGVVTYGGGQYMKKGNTFLSFKSGPIHGEAVSDIVENSWFPGLSPGWANFNPGHEHPDQNSFVFAPNGRYFITEALYAPKYSDLNNIVTFSPSPDSKCNSPWEGQVGECGKWLDYKHQIPASRGKIATVTTSGDMIHIAGEAVDAYRPELGLRSVQRSLLLLTSEVLLVLDTVVLYGDSQLKTASSLFHNILHSFHPYQHLDFNGAQVVYPEGAYAFFWLQQDGNSPTAKFVDHHYAADGKQSTHYVNITYPLNTDHATRVAYIFVGPNTKVHSVWFHEKSTDEIAYLSIVINNTEYKISIASLLVRTARRNSLLGFGGYLTLSDGDHVTQFGFEDTKMKVDRCDAVDDEEKTEKLVHKLISSIYPNPSALEEVIQTQKQESNPEKSQIYFFVVILNLVCFVCVVSLVCAVRKKTLVSASTKWFWKCLFLITVTWLFTLYHFMCHECPLIRKARQECPISDPAEFLYASTKQPMVVIASLPGFGAEFMEPMFANSSDFLYFTTDDVPPEVSGDDSSRYDACYWPPNFQGHPGTAGWFASTHTEPLLFLNNLQDPNPHMKHLQKKFRQLNKSPRFAINLLSGYWNTKLAWINNLIGHDMRTILVVRDPRDWIYSLIRDDLDYIQRKRQQKVLRNLLRTQSCAAPIRLPWEYVYMKKKDGKGGRDSLVEKLALIWARNIAVMIRTGRSLQVVRLEDLEKHPDKVVVEVFKRMGLTVSVPQINRVIRSVRTGYFPRLYEDAIKEDREQEWEDEMDEDEIELIENICSDVMRKLAYS